MRTPPITTLLPFLLALCCALSAGALAATHEGDAQARALAGRDANGRAGVAVDLPRRAMLPGGSSLHAAIRPDGTAVAPAGAPRAVREVIAAGNRIASAPYVYGGGHNVAFAGGGYDCSGSVSFALHGAGLLSAPLDSSGLAAWGEAGAGRWITVYGRGDHAFMTVAGLRFDTSGAAARGTRWSPAGASTAGYAVRHPHGL